MSSMIRVAALVVFATAACVSSNEVAQVAAVSPESMLVFSDMHAAIPAGKGNGNVFEYN